MKSSFSVKAAKTFTADIFVAGDIELTDLALELAEALVLGLHQGSASVVTSVNTYFISRREND